MDLLFYPRKNDATSASGRCSIYCKITVNKLSCVPFSTGIKIYAKKWDATKKTTNDQFGDTIRQEINRLENILRRIKIDIEERQEPITAEIIKYQYQTMVREQTQTKPKPEDTTTLESIYQLLTEKKMRAGAKHSTDRHDYYTSKAFLDFTKKRGWKDIKPASVSLELVDDFCQNFEKSSNYLRSIINFLKITLNFALKKKLITHNPINDMDMPKKGVGKKDNEIGLEPEEIEILKNAALSEKEQKAIDVFLFMCGTSLDFCDYNNISEENIENIGNKLLIRCERKKTNKYNTNRICRHNSIIKPVALEVLDKYGSVAGLPRFNCPSYLDKILNVIAKRNGIIKNLTTKRARKTFANISINHEMQTDEQVAYQMGHTNTNQLKHYRRYSDTILSNLLK